MSAVRAAITGAALTAGMVLSPRVIQACAVCTAGREDESNAAFLVSTIFLSLLPLGALGTLVYVLWRRFRKLEEGRSQAVTEPESVGAPAAPIG